MKEASVTAGGEVLGRIGRGMLAFVGITQSDGASQVRWMCDKIARLRIFEDEAGKMNRSVSEVGGGILLVSQFTLYGDAAGGNRPSFTEAAPAREEGTPQGGPLSPVLSNILLDDLDKELERRGHRFCRYADDCNVYVKSKAAGDRVMESVARYLEKRLRLKINRDKSAVGRPWNRKFLGYTMTSHHRTKLKVSPQSMKRAKAHIKEIMRKGRGRSVAKVIGEITPFLRGWVAYFRLSQVKNVFEEMDQWIRRKLRAVLWRQWKRPWTRAKRMIERGIERVRAWTSGMNGRGPWWNAGAPHMNAAVTAKWLQNQGLVSLLAEHQRLASLA